MFSFDSNRPSAGGGLLVSVTTPMWVLICGSDNNGPKQGTI
jgi:hypothetical protein